MIAMNATSRVALAAMLSLSLHAAHAEGLADSLPPNSMSQSCAEPAQLSLARAGAAVHAAYFPLQPLVTESVLGVLLHDDPRAIAVIRRSLGERPPPGWSNASHCSNTVCALKAALGGQGSDDQAWEGALWALEIGAHGVVASLDQAPWPSGKLSLWTASELHTVAAALHDLPAETLARASNLRVIRRAPNGDSLQGNSNALSERSEHRLDGGGSINLSDKVWKMNPQQKREIIVHEIGHHFDYAEEKRTHLKYAVSHGDEWLSIVDRGVMAQRGVRQLDRRIPIPGAIASRLLPEGIRLCRTILRPQLPIGRFRPGSRSLGRDGGRCAGALSRLRSDGPRRDRATRWRSSDAADVGLAEL